MNERSIAYFSMELGLEAGLPTYSGGLGVLAGDTIRSAADLKLPMVAVSLLHRRGYFHQKLDSSGWQSEEPVEWVVEDFLAEMPERAAVTIEGRTVALRSWRYELRGNGGFSVPVYLLDAALPENSDWDRTLTDHLYGGDLRYRLGQEVILGMGGLRMLRALGYRGIERFHMNEGHSSLLTLELLEEQAGKAGRGAVTPEDVEAVRSQCVFTSHTPVPAGHDKFPLELARSVLGHRPALARQDISCCDGVLNLTHLALNLSGYVNGVAKKHGEVSRQMFEGYQVDSITNGVHPATWTAEDFQVLFDRHIPGWREDNFSLRYALNIPREEVWEAHLRSKRKLIERVNREANAGMDVDVLTLGFARRATTYKRGDLLFEDPERLRQITSRVGPFQVVYAGKAHPRDQGGKELIKRVFDFKRLLKGEIRIAYLENYDMELARVMTAGGDVWLNTPQPPLEASGTSGMKAALNGVPSLSILDGWWIEGHIEGITGWAIGRPAQGQAAGQSSQGATDRAGDASSLYQKLEEVVIPLFYRKQEGFIDVMRQAIALNGSFFNTQRMVQEYVLKAYFR